MANKGLKEEETFVSFEIDDIKINIDLAKPNKNIIAIIPITLNVGYKPISLNLFYNDQNKLEETIVGKGYRLEAYKEIQNNNGNIDIHNADGSIDEYLFLSSSSGEVKYKNPLDNSILTKNDMEDYYAYDIRDKYNNLIEYQEDGNLTYIRRIIILGDNEYNYSDIDLFTNNQVNVLDNFGHKLVLNFDDDIDIQTNNKITSFLYYENYNTPNPNLLYQGEIKYLDDKISNIKIQKNNTCVKDYLINYTNGITIKDNITKEIIAIIQNNDLVTINEGYYLNDTSCYFKQTIVNYINNYKTTVTNVDLIENSNNDFVTTYLFDDNYMLEEIIDNNTFVKTLKYSNQIKKMMYETSYIYQGIDSTNIFNLISYSPSSSETYTKTMILSSVTPSAYTNILSNMCKNTSSGEIIYTRTLVGIAKDSYSLVLWVKRDLYSPVGNGYLDISFKLGSTEDAMFINSYDLSTNYKMICLSLTSFETFSYLEFKIKITGTLKVEFGRLEIYNNNYKTNYEYEDTNLIGSESGEYTSYGFYNSNNILDKSYGNNTKTVGKKYDNNNLLIEEQTPQNIVKKYTYNNDYQIFKESLIYNDDNNPLWEEEYTYQNKELTSFKNKYDGVSHYSYSNHNLVSKTDCLNNTMNYIYDNFDDIIEIHRYNMADYLDINYDSNRFVDNVDTPAQLNYKYLYDNKRRLASIKIKNQIVESYGYNDNNLVTSITRFNDIYTFIYDNLERIDEIKLNNNLKYKFYYDNKSRVVDIKIPSGNNLVSIKTYSYDDKDNLIDVLQQNIFNLEYIYHQNTKAFEIRNINGNKLYLEEIGINNSISKNPLNLDCYIRSVNNIMGTSFISGTKLIGNNCEAESFSVINGNEPLVIFDDIYALTTFATYKILGYKGGTYQSSETKAVGIAMWFYPTGFSDGMPIFDILDDNTTLSKRVICHINSNYKIEIRIKNKNGNNQFVMEASNIINTNHWHFISFSYEYNQYLGFIYKINVDGRYSEYVSQNTNYDLGTIALANYHIGYSSDTYISRFSGYITALSISNGRIITEDDMDDYYRLSKRFIIKKEDIDGTIYLSSTIEYKKDLLETYDIIPLHSNVISLKGIRPVKYNYTVGGKFIFDNFDYNIELKNMCYSINDGLTYNYNLSNSGTVIINCYINMVNGKAYLIDNDNGSRVSVYLMNNTLHFEFKNNSSSSIVSVDTNLAFSLNEWHIVGLSYKYYQSKLYYRVLLDDNEFSSSFNSVSPLSQMLTALGKSESGNYSFDGQINMAAINQNYIESSNEYNAIKSNLCYYSKINKYDKFEHLIKEEINKNRINILSKTYTYDKDRITSEQIIYGNNTKTRSYTYNANGMITYISDSFFGNHFYSYDSLNRIISESNTSYSYDMDGNIISIGNITFVNDNKNRLTSVGGNSVYYSSTGNIYLPMEYKNHRYRYEGNRLTGVTIYESDVIIYIDYVYDEKGLLIERTQENYYWEDEFDEIFITKLYYDENNRLICEIDNGTRYDYLYNDSGLYGLVKNLSTRYYYIKDILGTIIGMVDESGNIIGKKDYDAFGNIISSSGNILGNIIYKDYYYDYEAELYYLKSRFYKPEWRRFLTPDSFEYLDIYNLNGINLYTYCENNPVMGMDPTGHFGICLALLIGAGIGALFGAGVSGVSAYSQGERGWDLFFDSLGGALMGAATGVASVLGGAAGLTAIYGAGAVAGYGLSSGVALGISMGATAIGGMAKYGLDYAASPNANQFSVENLIYSGVNGAIQGLFTFSIAYGMGKLGAFNNTFDVNMVDYYSRAGVNIGNFAVGVVKSNIGSLATKLLLSTMPAAAVRFLLDSIKIKER